MRLSDFIGKNIVIWGTGREGIAAAQFLRRLAPHQPIIFVDDAPGDPIAESVVSAPASTIRGREGILPALKNAGLVVKSPGISLYDSRVRGLIARGTRVTSLLNLWFATGPKCKTILVTGTKGKSTTAALLSHVLTSLGRKAFLAGNIGCPVTGIPGDVDFAVIETSSYQAADFDGTADIGVLTSLFPEHLDWHGSLDRYYRDKLNAILHSRIRIAASQAAETLRHAEIGVPDLNVVGDGHGIHAAGDTFYLGAVALGRIGNAYLARSHNLSNACVVLEVLRALGIDLRAGIGAMRDFKGLRHRQFELGVRDGLLFVDDSISTTPQSTIAALDAYAGRAVTLILGGYDRGISYEPLVHHLTNARANGLICMGQTGARIFPELSAAGMKPVAVQTMAEAVAAAREATPMGGVVLLSPGAPSYGLFRDFQERGEAFAKAAGFR